MLHYSDTLLIWIGGGNMNMQKLKIKLKAYKNSVVVWLIFWANLKFFIAKVTSARCGFVKVVSLIIGQKASMT